MPRAPPTPALKSRGRAPLPPPRGVAGGGVGGWPRTGPASVTGMVHTGLSLIAAYDDLMRCGSVFHSGAEREFWSVTGKIKELRQRWLAAENDRRQMAISLKERENELTAKDYKIQQARKMVEDERRGRLAAEQDRDAFAQQLDMLKDILLSPNSDRVIDNETLERVRHIDTTRRHSPYKGQAHPLTAVEESIESILDVSDLSFDDNTRDNLEASRTRQKRRSSARHEVKKGRKSRSLGHRLDSGGGGEPILTTTTRVIVDQAGQPHAESVIEAVPVKMDVSMRELKRAARKSRESRGEGRVTYNERPEFEPSAPPYNGEDWPTTPRVKRHISNASSVPTRPHFFTKKGVVVSERCQPCGKRMGFRRTCLKCRDCGVICHPDCRNDVPIPCMGSGNRTPTARPNEKAALVDFCSNEPPMIPAILMHCIREVEARGLDEVGIYRIPGNEADALNLLEKFMRDKCAPSLSRYDIHVITSTVKKFLKSLKEPIIPQSLRRVFVDAATNPNSTDGDAALYQAISELPRPNRDTLAYLILHLQRVADSPDCKMTLDTLSTCMGPTIVGFSTNDPAQALAEAGVPREVTRALIHLSSDYWSNFLQYEQENLFPRLSTPDPGPTTAKTPYKSVVAQRTRSRISSHQKPQYFHSPMLF